MIAFLIKVRVKTIFSNFNPIKVEPLELCCLKTLLEMLDIENYILDELFGFKVPKGIIPDIIILNGYNVAEDEIIRQAVCYKSEYPKSKIIVGGVHVQGNSEEFHHKAIDYVFHSQSLKELGRLLDKIAANPDETYLIDGADTFISSKETGKDCWHTGDRMPIFENENILADRSFFNQKSDCIHYLEKRKVALIKGSIGCPYDCSYCYCKMINQSQFVKADYDRMAEEMKNIDADYFWIVDDVLFSDRRDALDLIDVIKKKKIKVKMIGYLRADFILQEKDLLEDLREIGLAEVIVGFEATNNSELEMYGKTTDALDYPAVISLLKQNDIDLTALFMVKPDYGIRDFRKLSEFIGDNNIRVFTVSILTPMKGTEGYRQMEDALLTQNSEKFDFLHLVVKPRLPRFLFYALFYGIQLKLLKSKRIWKYILRK